MKRAVMNYRTLKRIHKFRQTTDREMGEREALVTAEGQMVTNAEEAWAPKTPNLGTITVQAGTS